MKGQKISDDLMRSLRNNPAPERPKEYYDSNTKGFLVRHQPSGLLSFYLQYRRANGTQTRVLIGRYGDKTLTAARTEAEKLRTATRHEALDPAAARKVSRKAAREEKTLKEFIEDVYEPYVTVSKRAGKEAIQAIRSGFANFMDRRLAEIDKPALLTWRVKYLTRKNKQGEPVKNSSANRMIGQISALLSYAVEMKHLEANPALKIDHLEEQKDDSVRYLSENEEVRLRAALDERETKKRRGRESANAWRAERELPLFPARGSPYVDYLKPLVLLAMNTGCRHAELLTLTWSNVDLEKAIIDVRAAFTKSAKTRTIALNSEALQILTDWKRQQAGRSKYVFPGRSGKPLTTTQSVWRNLRKKAHIKAFRWHDMRHHFASRLVIEGVSLYAVQGLLGHSSPKQTQRYAKLSPRVNAEAVERLVRPAAGSGQAQTKRKVVDIRRTLTQE